MARRTALAGTVTALAGSVVFQVSFIVGPQEPPTQQHLVPSMEALALALVLIGGLAGFVGRDWKGWVAALAGHSLALVAYGLARASYAGTMMGASVVMPRADFVAAVAVLAIGSYLAVTAGYATAALVIVRGSSARLRVAGGLAAWPMVAALAMIAIASLALGAWLSATGLRIGEGEPGVLVHRVTISEKGIVLDATSIPRGRVTFLVTVVGSPPPDLGLEDLGGSTSVAVYTPPNGSVDFSIGRYDMTPGAWRLVAGSGTMAALFTVTD